MLGDRTNMQNDLSSGGEEGMSQEHCARIEDDNFLSQVPAFHGDRVH